VQQNIAETIRKGWSPELTKAMKLPEQARRLDRSLKVAVQWMEAAREDSSEMWAQAQYARDSIEEELSRVCFEMAAEEETLLHATAYKNQTPERREGRRQRSSDEDLPEVARLSALSNMLLTAYANWATWRRITSGTGAPGRGMGSWVRSWWPRTS